MNISLSSLKFFAKNGPAPSGFGETHGGWLLWGLGALLVFLIGLIAFDGYLFYFARTNGAQDRAQDSAGTLSPREIDEAIELLDQREREFNALLNP